jgi:hypothetical protein
MVDIIGNKLTLQIGTSSSLNYLQANIKTMRI